MFSYRPLTSQRCPISLTSVAFEARADKLEELMADGHADLEVFMKVCALNWVDLVAVGLVRLKHLQSTADHIAYEPTATGRKYLKA